MSWTTTVPDIPAWLKPRDKSRRFTIIALGAMVFVAAVILSLISLSSAHYKPSHRPTPQSPLASFTLDKVLNDVAPIFGAYVNEQTGTSTWMEKYADSTLLIHMNLPGTHDTATWNYTLATQDALRHVTSIGDVLPQSSPDYWRCQQQPIISMLNAGIRVFDVRYAFDVTNSSLIFWHGPALLSQTATVDDVMYGYYRWLDDHPSETILLSFQYEGGTTSHAANNADVQLALYNILTTPAAQHYLLPRKDSLGTLGEARGRIVLLRRFDLSALPASYAAALPGLHFPPAAWGDNGADNALVYNEEQNLTAYIEDYYEIDAPLGSDANTAIQWKYNATTAHLRQAADLQYADSMFWTFASSEYDANSPPEYPRIMALGNGSDTTPEGGVNQRLMRFLGEMEGKRLGIVMFDFYDQPPGLIDFFLDL